MSPSSRTTSLTFRCPNDLADWLKAESERLGLSVSQIVVLAIENRKDDDATV